MRNYTFDSNILDPTIFPDERGAPHALFDMWRNDDPVHWNPPTKDYVTQVPGSKMERGFWVLTKHKDVCDVSMDQKRFSSYEDGFVIWDVSPDELERQRANFMGMKPVDHTAVRRVMMSSFMPKALQQMQPKIDKLAKEIVDSIADRGDCEFVFDVAAKLPVYTFCELMGIPESYRDVVTELGNQMADVETRGQLEVNPAIRLSQIAEELSEMKRSNPDDLLLSTIVNSKELNLSQMEINQFFSVFAIAGHETTRSSASHFIYLMNKNPDQYQLLLSDVDKYLENAVDEVLRFTSTTTNFRRTATEDVELGGHIVRKGEKVYLSYAAANRDPAIFPDPHKFDITRKNASKHLAFGIGPHVCIGARLARNQLSALLRQIVTRLPDIKLDGEAEWLRSIWFNAIIKLPVKFTPENAARN